MRHESGPNPLGPDDVRCAELWHAEVQRGPFCTEELGHELPHQGFGYRWSEESHADPDVARRFLQGYRAIPNGYKNIILGDDGTVTMDMAAFKQATQFIDVRTSD